jgi:uncharacterized protein (TIGR00369 family)
MVDLNTIQKLIEPLFPGTLGIEFKVLELERVVAELHVRPNLCTSGGIMHGGAYMAFADTLGAVGTLLNLSEGQRTTTTDSSTKFIAGAKVGSSVVGESIALHRGRTTMVWQTMIKNDQGKLCAVVTQTQLVMNG